MQYPYGYPIHARCWDLIERLFGPLTESHQLGTLIEVLRRRWLGDSRFYIFGSPRDLSPKKFGEREEEEELLVTEQRFFAFQDPVKIPALRALINEGLQRRRREQLKRRTRRWCHLSSSTTSAPMSIEHLTTSRPVPLDTKYLIWTGLAGKISQCACCFWVVPDPG